jgi:RNA polymerase sigma-70 factor (family 1)
MFDFLLTLSPLPERLRLLYHSDYNEKELLQRVASGDQNAFSALFYRYHQELAAYVLRLTRSISLTEEIVQDTFLKLWVGKERLPEVNDFRSYLFAVSRNHTFNSLRDLARKAVQRRAWISLEIEQVRDREEPDREYYYTLIEEAVDRLSPQQQRVYLLSRRDGLKYEEIADQLQLSRNTVKRHMSLALHTIVSYVRLHAARVLPFIILFFNPL